MKVFNNNSFRVLEKSLTALTKKHKAISNNIANVDTPGYKRRDVNFKQKLAKALRGGNDLTVTNNKHISLSPKDLKSFKSKIYVEEDTTNRNDGNNVSIDAEMANLAKTNLEYQALSKQLKNQFNRLDLVINKGGK